MTTYTYDRPQRHDGKSMNILIVKNQFGFVATLRFEDSTKDRILSSTTKQGIYEAIDKHVAKLT